MENIDWGEVRIEEITQQQLFDMKKESAWQEERSSNGSLIYWFPNARVVEMYQNKAGLAKYYRQFFEILPTVF